MTCDNAAHRGDPQDYCAGCARACEAELTALRDRHMRLLTECAMWRTKATQASDRGEVPPLPADRREGTAANAAGFEAIDGSDVLQVTGRTTPPREDVLAARIFHATTGGGRSILLRRPAAEALHDWLARWLAEGWDGVPRACGRAYRPDRLHEWRCDDEPGHLGDHEGPCTGWSAQDHGKPGRARWPGTGRAAADAGQRLHRDTARAPRPRLLPGEACQCAGCNLIRDMDTQLTAKEASDA